MGFAYHDYLVEFIRTDARPTFILDSTSEAIVYTNFAFDKLLGGSHDGLLGAIGSAIGDETSALEPECLQLQTSFRSYQLILRKIALNGSRDGCYVGVLEATSLPNPDRDPDLVSDGKQSSSASSSTLSPQTVNTSVNASDNAGHKTFRSLSMLAITHTLSQAQEAVIRAHGGSLPCLDWTVPECPIPFGEARKHFNLLHSIDWGNTAVGPMNSWSTSLRTAVNTIMYMTQPIVLYAGYDYINIYNLAWGLQVAQERHPYIMGKTVPVAWPEGHEYLVPLIDKTLLGETVIREAALFYLNKSVPGEESYVSFILSPAIDDQGFYLGTFAYAVFETDSIIKKRHTKSLQILGSKLVQVKELGHQSGFWSAILDALDETPRDSPFVILYCVSEDGRRCEYVGSRGLDPKVCGNIDLDALGHTKSQNSLHGMPYRGFGICQDAITLPIRRHSGMAQAFLIIGQNHRRPLKITQTLDKKTKELRESETLFTRTAESVPVGLVCINNDGQIIFANDAWWRICGMDRSGGPDVWDKYIYVEDRERIVALFNQLVEERGSMAEEFRFGNDSRPGRGFTTWCRNSIHPSYDDDGNFTGWFGTLVDITSIKLAEEYQRELTAEAVERKRQQDNFIDVYVMNLYLFPKVLRRRHQLTCSELHRTSHELRNPLSAILQSADEIQMTLDALIDIDADPAALAAIQEAAETILACGEHQKKIIDDILNLSKLDAGLLTVDPVPAQPHDIIRRGMRIFVPELKSKGITAQFTLSDNFVADCMRDWWMVDPARLMQVLINLVTNAIKFTSQKNGAKEICVALDSSKDTGIGISKEMQAVLGQRFHQAPKTHVSYGGSGLGLFIARRLCFLLGGELHFDSDLGVGSTFSFFFHAQRTNPPTTHNTVSTPNEPVKRTYSFGSDTKSAAEDFISTPRRPSKPPPVKIQKVADRKPSSKRPRLGDGYRVLVVEDNILNQKILRKQLAAQGCETVTANNGEEALGLLKAGGKFTIVLMDMEMPVMDGATATGLIREYEAEAGGHVPIIGTSANARFEQVQFMINAGMVSYSTTPESQPYIVFRVPNRRKTEGLGCNLMTITTNMLETNMILG
ncbi:hypothetical protein TWF192_002509 [Orbilia oligospora]|nr:hypothetical protein TWF192_002509 [Orbilia oligospora]